MTAHYAKGDLDVALNRLPVEKGDVVFLHSNIGFFGRVEGASDSNTLCELFLSALMRRVGDYGTVVVPTFTYSFPRRQVFAPDETVSEMGLFAEWIRMHPSSIRSCDPSYSIAAIGHKAEMLTQNSPENSFAPDGFFGRFLAENGVVMNMNFDSGSTFIHYLERNSKVPYRFDKTFEGYIKEREIKRKAKNTISVRYMSDKATTPVFQEFHKLAIDAGYFHTAKLGRGQIGIIRSTDCERLVVATLPKRPWFLTEAEGAGKVPYLAPESTYQTI
jgi:aminoglycoside 3-N-acetyltransferase